MNTNNQSQKSVVLESSAKPRLGCQFGSSGLVWQKSQEPLTQVANLLGMVGVKGRFLTEQISTTTTNLTNKLKLHYSGGPVPNL